MKVLTLQEPWASLIAEKIKVIETRSWHTNYRGQIYIHAGIKKISKNDNLKLYCSTWLKNGLHYGKIIAKCNIIDCILIDKNFANKIKNNDNKCYLCGDFSIGRYAWILDNIEVLPKKIYAKGQLGLWNYKGE